MTETVVIAEINKGKVSPTTNELISAANILGSDCTLVIPCTDSSLADQVSNISGVSKIIAAKSSVFTNYDASGWAQALDSVAPQGIIVTAASAQSKDLAARIAARRNVSVVQDVISIVGTTLSTPIYSGKAIENVAINGNVVVSIRPNVFAGVSNDGSCEIQVIDASGDLSTAVKELVERASARLDVSEANIIISGGRGMGSPDNFSHLEAIADTLGAAVGASRAAVDTWDDIPHSMQVGQTGKTVNPNLYIAVGISGAIQHLAGMRSSKYIVAINKDADAPIFQYADYGIVSTWEEALPVLSSALSNMLS
ncbi:MAG: electron transfer flavoprotein subunit alpha/FixB family protein [Euryarchaeota archaeon]|jgi:electron transfer flavoprotein alpha subunit|nr:electron transfer flavoprotein subunit alpha/FixB family protein [Euryarchaeota archaeon]MBT7987443.1 electron transfer flavoprotein subunit alpha/FixB family protein [Euryarchaeota archaeon]